MIREAAAGDRDAVLAFCRDTFEWGDYVGGVWDSWAAEGGLLVYEAGGRPAGLCHSVVRGGRLWIEGVRVEPGSRRRGIASALVRRSERDGRGAGASSSFMLAGSENLPSLSMAGSLGYADAGGWEFYSLEAGPGGPARPGTAADVAGGGSYVDSWRWLPLDAAAARRLAAGGRIVSSSAGGARSSCIITEPAHFASPVATVYPGGRESASELLSHLRGLGARVHVLARSPLPPHAGLARRSSFRLLSRRL